MVRSGSLELDYYTEYVPIGIVGELTFRRFDIIRWRTVALGEATPTTSAQADASRTQCQGQGCAYGRLSPTPTAQLASALQNR